MYNICSYLPDLHLTLRQSSSAPGLEPIRALSSVGCLVGQVDITAVKEILAVATGESSDFMGFIPHMIFLRSVEQLQRFMGTPKKIGKGQVFTILVGFYSSNLFDLFGVANNISL